MRAKELRERGAKELEGLLDEARQNLFQSRIKNATHQLTDTSSIRKTRREVARLETVLSEKRKTPKSGAGEK